ncbi:hypothetical protein M426DRAFT_324904 [Hypoxylon sp. CI-4A]|nr:hypothetical protein M426DRAFT_324904 [Hypoxylon sp. CI-4A]
MEVDVSVIDAEILAVLGIVGQSTVLFIDVNLWVYSMEIRQGRASFSSMRITMQDEPEPASKRMLPVLIKRHFFALSEWRTASGELRCAIANRTGGPDFFFANRQYIVAIQGGLEFSEAIVPD